MIFIPEEFKYSVLRRINNFESKLPNCDYSDFIEAYKTVRNMFYMNFDPYITLNFGRKVLECNINGIQRQEQILELKKDLELIIQSLESIIEKEARRILI